MSTLTKKQIRAAKSAYAIFKTVDAESGYTSYFRQAVQFWQQRDDGSWAGMIVNEQGVRDAESFNNFVNFQPVRKDVYPTA